MYVARTNRRTLRGAHATMKPVTLLQKLWTRPLFWVMVDALLINVAFGLAYYVRYELQLLRAVDPANNVPYTAFLPFILILTALLLIAYRQKGLYRNKRRLSWLDELSTVFDGTTTGIIIMIVIVFAYRPTFYSRIIFLYAGAFIVLLLGLSRGLKVAMLGRWRRDGFGVARLLLVGAGEIARTIMRAVVANPALGYEIVGFVDDDATKAHTNIGRFAALGEIDNLPTLLQERAVDEVIITLPWQYHRKIMSITNLCERANVRARIVPDMFQITLSRMDITQLAGIPVIGMKQHTISRGNQMLKRAIDFTVALTGLVVFFPLMALIALAIKLESEGPVLFTQERIGKGGRPFRIYKFRSMVHDAEEQKAVLEQMNEADGPLFKIRDDPRRTRVGRLLRKFSLDELPQLYNVLRGEMSLVGPRPNIPAEVAQYQEWHKRRLEVTPGITGLWAVSGRSDLAFDEMMLLDIYYVENWSLTLDLKILLQTIPRVLTGAGAY
ncbi:MAG: undecaprenyl-phosphate glucose phosphotransferase [Caldilineae bacterium]|nr:MAG: undecaprenyl-phosphate glucose phosphotransferase [Caldilineae bacterium]